MDPKDFLKTKYAQQLLAEMSEIQSELARFNETWKCFWERNIDDLGTILMCHLTVEHYLNDWFSAANPAIKIVQNSRLAFSHKLELVEGADPFVRYLLPGLRRLNRIRNQIAHNLEATLTESDLEPIGAIVWPWQEAQGQPRSTGVILLKEFALLASGFLQSQANAIRKFGDGKGLIAYQRWLQDAMQIQADD